MENVKMSGLLDDQQVMTAIATVALKNEELIKEKLFTTENIKGAEKQVYAVNLHVMGQPKTIMVDDYLPVIKQNAMSKQANKVADGAIDLLQPKGFSAQFGTKEGLWVAILEKAIAKVHGNYMHLERWNDGNAADIITMMTGDPYFETVHDKAQMKRDIKTYSQQIKELLHVNLEKQNFVTGKTSFETMFDRSTKNISQMRSNYFTVVGLKEVKGETYVLLSHPTGETTKWKANNQQLKMLEIPKSTTFGLTVEDYTKVFVSTFVNYNDMMSVVQFYQGTSVDQHAPKVQANLMVRTKEAQTVYLTAHTTPYSFFPRSRTCVERNSMIFDNP